MGEWMTFPDVEKVIAERVGRFHCPKGRRLWTRPHTSPYSDLDTAVDKDDIAKLDDIYDMVPLWDCEYVTDDGF